MLRVASHSNRNLSMPNVAVTFLLLLLLYLQAIHSFPLLSLPVDGTACEWNVWDDTVEERSVQKISIRCSEGRVTWRTPYGGLAIAFLAPLQSRPFQLCFIAESAFTTQQLFLEANQTLVPIAIMDSSRSILDHEVCLDSVGDQSINIFIETDSTSSSPVLGKMVLEYDVRVIEDEPKEECSPCSVDEIVLAACSADYAVVGEIHSISDSRDSAKSDLHVNVSHTIRQRYRVVRDHLLVGGNDRRGRKQNDNGQVASFQNQRESQRDHFLIDDRRRQSLNTRVRRGSESSSSNQRSSPGYNLSIVVPGKCRIRQGKGVFLFMGSIRLRRARLQCAPRLTEFHRIWSAAVLAGTNPCTIKYL